MDCNAFATASRDPSLILILDEALERLAEHDRGAAEVVRLRFYAGMSVEEVAEAIGSSTRTVNRLWTYARAWLWRELGADASD